MIALERRKKKPPIIHDFITKPNPEPITVKVLPLEEINAIENDLLHFMETGSISSNAFITSNIATRIVLENLVDNLLIHSKNELVKDWFNKWIFNKKGKWSGFENETEEVLNYTRYSETKLLSEHIEYRAEWESMTASVAWTNCDHYETSIHVKNSLFFCACFENDFLFIDNPPPMNLIPSVQKNILIQARICGIINSGGI